MTNYKIEKGVPIPARGGDIPAGVYPFKAMKAGDSFFVQCEKKTNEQSSKCVTYGWQAIGQDQEVHHQKKRQGRENLENQIIYLYLYLLGCFTMFFGILMFKYGDGDKPSLTVGEYGLCLLSWVMVFVFLFVMVVDKGEEVKERNKI